MSDRLARYGAELEALLTELTPKQELFCREYFIDLNATQAAKRAGYKGSVNTLRSVGSENMAKPAILAAIDAFFERKCEDIEINAALIEREYWSLYRECRDTKDKPVARACLKDLGEHHAMFIKVVAQAETVELARRLATGRERMNLAERPAVAGSELEH